MALKTYNPTSPGRRALVLVDRSELHKGRPEKSLTEGLTKSGGRGQGGRIAVRFRGGGAKRLYRVVDFKRTKFDVAAVVERIEYDPNRTARIALPQATELRSGGFANVVVEGAKSQRPLLPQSAVLSDRDGNYVLTVGADNAVKRMPVKTGSVTRNGVVILSGMAGLGGGVLRDLLIGQTPPVGVSPPAARHAAKPPSCRRPSDRSPTTTAQPIAAYPASRLQCPCNNRSATYGFQIASVAARN